MQTDFLNVLVDTAQDTVCDLLSKPVEQLSDIELSEVSIYLDEEYRKGESKISDTEFDMIYVKALEKRIPDHALLHLIPSTPIIGAKGQIKHPSPMISTNKSYTKKAVEAWLNRALKAGLSLGLQAQDITIRVTSKMDGISGRFDSHNNLLVSRGNGEFGTDITHLIEHGLVIVGGSGKDCIGEIVINKDIFNKYLSKDVLGEDGFADPRGFISGIANSDVVKEKGLEALKNGWVELVVYKDMPYTNIQADKFLDACDLLEQKHLQSPYLLDGVVVEIVNADLKDILGSNSHHHNWQIALKKIEGIKRTVVNSVRWQVGRTSVISPILAVESVELSKAQVSSITAHSLGYLKSHKLGEGATIEAYRAGSVIPRHHKTLIGVEVIVPQSCPVCDAPTIIKQQQSDTNEYNEFLYCTGSSCGGSAVSALFHSFKRLNIDLFGQVACEKLVDADIATLEQIFVMNACDFEKVGFGSGQAVNLVNELSRGLREPLNDNNLISALGIHLLGRGSAEKLLKGHKIDMLSQLTQADIMSLDGFAEISSKVIVDGLNEKKDTLDFLLNLGFNLVHTSEKVAITRDSKLSGLKICFTGKMHSGSREELTEQAKQLGAVVQSSINKSCSVLVIGSAVGAVKLNKATKLGVEIIEEDEYLKRFDLAG